MRQVAKIIIFLNDALLFSIKRAPRKSGNDGKLELLGGHIEKGETPFHGLIRELAEEDEGSFIANKVALLRLTPVEITVEGARHFVYRMPIAESELQSIRMNPMESYGYRLIQMSRIMDREQMSDRSLFTRRTVKIFAKLRCGRYFPYDHA